MIVHGAWMDGGKETMMMEKRKFVNLCSKFEIKFTWSTTRWWCGAMYEIEFHNHYEVVIIFMKWINFLSWNNINPLTTEEFFELKFKWKCMCSHGKS